MSLTILTLADARDAPTGAQLYRYHMVLSCEVRESGDVIVVTATSPKDIKNATTEIWEAASDMEALDPDGIFDRNHKEEIEDVRAFLKPCTETKAMDFGEPNP